MVKADVLLEVSWEVCNKVGGINTVIKSKVPSLTKFYPNHSYYLIGPYFADKALGEFEEAPPADICKPFCDELSKMGISLHFGKWLVEEEPNTILIDFQNYLFKSNDIKKELWDAFKIDSLRGGNDYSEPLVWSYVSGLVIQKLQQTLFKDKKIVVQFHEWLAGAGLLFLKKNNVPVSTVFTTHATILGRTMASSGIDLYCEVKDNKCTLELIDPFEEAFKFNVESKHSIESAAANNADVFTTVSEVTGEEASHLLKRKPDVLLLNGLDMTKFPTFEESSLDHRNNRNSIREFLLYYFFPHYTFDINNTLFYFIAGRYEFKDKGIDVFINALDKLNNLLKKKKSKKTIIAFIFVPAHIRAIKTSLLINKTNFEDISESIYSSRHSVQNNILYDLIAEKPLSEKTIFSKTFLFSLKRKLKRLKQKDNPPLVTHDLFNQDDIIVSSLMNAGLDNGPDDRVKVVFYPIYLTGADRLLNLDYYEVMSGCHLGVFPSFYEPWGYTPLEAAALGTASITTDLAGFGRFVAKEKSSDLTPGIFVLKRQGMSDDKITNSLADFMFKFSQYDKHNRVQNKIEAKRLASLADWNKFIDFYIQAHDLAIDKKGK